jgi:hypothetical protein
MTAILVRERMGLGCGHEGLETGRGGFAEDTGQLLQWLGGERWCRELRLSLEVAGEWG